MITIHPMDGLTETQAMLQDSLARYLADQHDLEARRRDPAGQARSLWRGLVQTLGIVGSAFPEDLGGMGGGMAEHQVILETLGRSLAAEPYLSTAVIGGGFLRRSPNPAARTLLGGLLDGQVLTAFAFAEAQGRDDLADLTCTLHETPAGLVLDGRKVVVHGASSASHLLVTARSSGSRQAREGVSLVVVPIGTAGIRRRDYPLIDGGSASEIRFDQVQLTAEALLAPLGQALPLVETVVDEATLALCAEATGVLSRLLEDSIAYARQRRQFGVAIASFQVLQHRIVDMYLALSQARALTRLVVSQLGDASDAERARGVSSAKVAVAKACRKLGQGAVQIHGGMGMTDELAIGHYFKRATVIEQRFGGIDHHLRRCDQLAQRQTLARA